MSSRPRIAVLASGAGSNAEAIAAACESGELPAQLALILSNVPGAGVLARAEARRIPARCIAHRDYPSRDAFELALLEALRAAAVDFVALAGFMRILTDRFIGEYCGSLLNIHPSLLPKYPGLGTHQRAIDAGDSEAGASVHFVTAQLDGGPNILQARVPVLPDDDAETLAARVRREEHRIYPTALAWCVGGRVVYRDGRVIMDGKALTKPCIAPAV